MLLQCGRGDHIVPDVVDQRRFVQTRRTAGSHRITSRSSSATGLRQLRTHGRNTSEVPYRGNVEPRYSMAAEIPVEASRRIAAEAIRVGAGLALHKYKPAVTGTIPRLSRRRRSSVNTYHGSDAHTYT